MFTHPTFWLADPDMYIIKYINKVTSLLQVEQGEETRNRLQLFLDLPLLGDTKGDTNYWTFLSIVLYTSPIIHKWAFINTKRFNHTNGGLLQWYIQLCSIDTHINTQPQFKKAWVTRAQIGGQHVLSNQLLVPTVLCTHSLLPLIRVLYILMVEPPPLGSVHGVGSSYTKSPGWYVGRTLASKPWSEHCPSRWCVQCP